MYLTAVKEFTFDAAHYLPEHKGQCKNLHGHTYKLQIGVTRFIPFPNTQINVNEGMVIDFSDLKQIVKYSIIDHLDHSCLNDVDINGFPSRFPTAENMVFWMVCTLTEYLPDCFTLTFVRLYETPTSYVEWRRR